jgi:hypothetical protein
LADVGSTLASWSSTTGSNSPAGATNISTGLDDNLRELQGVVVRGLSHKGADIASAGTTDLGAIEGLMHDITGTTTITSFGTVRAGIWKIVKFEGALTLTHNATSLILPGGINITTADGDIAIFISEGSGNWRCVSYFYAAGEIIGTFTPVLTFATPGNVSVTYSIQLGFYTKVGDTVHVWIVIATSAFTHTTAADNLQITGLPFASKNTANFFQVGNVVWQGITKANYTQVNSHIGVNSSIMELRASGSGQSLDAVTFSDVPTGGSVAFRIQHTYKA